MQNWQAALQLAADLKFWAWRKKYCQHLGCTYSSCLTHQSHVKSPTNKPIRGAFMLNEDFHHSSYASMNLARCQSEARCGEGTLPAFSCALAAISWRPMRSNALFDDTSTRLNNERTVLSLRPRRASIQSSMRLSAHAVSSNSVWLSNWLRDDIFRLRERKDLIARALVGSMTCFRRSEQDIAVWQRRWGKRRLTF